MRPKPQTKPSPEGRCSVMPKSVQWCLTNSSSSSKEFSSRSSSMRSRALSFPSLCWRSRRSAPPPASASARRCASSSSGLVECFLGAMAGGLACHRGTKAASGRQEIFAGTSDYPTYQELAIAVGQFGCRDRFRVADHAPRNTSQCDEGEDKCYLCVAAIPVQWEPSQPENESESRREGPSAGKPSKMRTSSTTNRPSSGITRASTCHVYPP